MGASERIKAVLFDLFDTLLLVERVSDLSERCIRSVYLFLVKSGINVSFDSFMRAYAEVRKQVYERIEKYFEEPHFSIRILQTLARLNYDYDSVFLIAWGATEAYMEEFTRYIRLDEEAIPVLQHLRESGYKTGVISNFSIPEGARKLIAEYGLKRLLDTIVISGEINRRKPSPEIFITALNHLKVRPSEAIFVGDTPDVDIRGAKGVGMKTVLIDRWGINIDLTEDKPDFTIKSLKEILNLLRR